MNRSSLLDPAPRVDFGVHQDHAWSSNFSVFHSTDVVGVYCELNESNSLSFEGGNQYILAGRYSSRNADDTWTQQWRSKGKCSSGTVLDNSTRHISKQRLNPLNDSPKGARISTFRPNPNGVGYGIHGDAIVKGEHSGVFTSEFFEFDR